MVEDRMQEDVRNPATNSPADIDHVELAKRLKDARMYLGLSQEFVAEQLDVPRASVSAMESGKRRVSSLELKRLATLYKRPFSYFLDTTDATEGGALGPLDDVSRALFRTANDLTPDDREQVLRFAQFLKEAGKAPLPPREAESS